MGQKLSSFWDQSFFIPPPTFTSTHLPNHTGKVPIPHLPIPTHSTPSNPLNTDSPHNRRLRGHRSTPLPAPLRPQRNTLPRRPLGTQSPCRNHPTTQRFPHLDRPPRIPLSRPRRPVYHRARSTTLPLPRSTTRRPRQQRSYHGAAPRQ
jgi:hypothetical protein